MSMASAVQLGLWNSTIRNYVRHRQASKALQMFHQMYQEAVIADMNIIISILTACANLLDYINGKLIHARTWPGSVHYDTRSGNALVNMYGKCASLKNAQYVFDLIQQRDIVSWSVMIAVHVKHRCNEEAFLLFKAMQEEGILPNRVTFVSILSACAHASAINEGKWIHARITEGGDVVLETALVNFYGKCGKLKDAQDIFGSMLNQDVIAWNAIIAASGYDNHGKSIFRLFDQMQMAGFRPDKVTFTSMIDACANHFLFVEGMELHAFIIENGFEQDVVIATALFDMYGRCGSLCDTHKVFDKMLNRNLITWNALIAVYGQHGLGKEVIHIFRIMEEIGVIADNITFISTIDACANLPTPFEGQQMHIDIVKKGLDSDRVIGNALINMYGKHDKLDDAQCVFNQMPEWDVVSWTSMVSIYSLEGRSREALKIFEKMYAEKVQPDKVAFIGGLAACSSHMALADGKQMHAFICDSEIEMDINMWNALVTMYAKCGDVEAALEIFKKMPNHDLISWNAVITAFAQHGLGKDAIQFYQRMHLEGFLPTKVTFVGVLTACSHAGLLDEGFRFFACMDDYKGQVIDVDHYDCMIDLLGRSGCLMESEFLVNKMSFQPTNLSCLALLGSCRLAADAIRGEVIAKMLYELDPHNAAPYVMLSNIYVVTGRQTNNNKILDRNVQDWDLQTPIFIEEDE